MSCNTECHWTIATWTMYNYSLSTVTVTPKGNCSESSAFTLRTGQSKKISWYDDGKTAYHYTYSPSNKVYTAKYENIMEIHFYSK